MAHGEHWLHPTVDSLLCEREISKAKDGNEVLIGLL